MTAHKKPTSAAKRRKAPSRKGGPEARVEAMRLLAEGEQVASVARQFGVRDNTVRDWRDSPGGQIELNAARKAREASFADAAEDARRILRENAAKAAQVIADQLNDADPAVRSLAARTLMDRIGVPRTQRVESVEPEGPDLSALSDEDFAELRRIKAKMKATSA